MRRWLTVIGIGEDGLGSLPASSIERIKQAEVLVGGARHLAKVPDFGAERLDWGKGFFDAVETLDSYKTKNVVVLASGDPMNFGAGSTLRKRFSAEEMTIIPAPGAFSLAASRMGWSLPDVHRITVHGRPLEAVNLYLTPGAKLLILSRDGTTPRALADLLCGQGFGDSVIHVFEHMGGDLENHIAKTATGWCIERTADLNTIALDCVAGEAATFWPRVPGLPEAAFEHDGKITKREVRAATLALLAPMPGETLWDIGAGSGAVGIEWMRVDPSLKTVAFENEANKCEVIARNAANLGVPRLKVIEGDAGQEISKIENTPDAIFLGGGVSDLDLMNTCWDRLSNGGRLVANGVTVEAHAALMAFHNKHGGTLTRISVARSDAVGRLTALRPLMDVLQMKTEKQ
jgi:precorrin-6B C5,15-methyltransferase / cobalt-precorrin-6B C5,C15-methyltransferase